MNPSIASFPIDKQSEIEEALVHIYLRLNGYFASGFIPHSPGQGIRTDIDVLAVRFPLNREPERDVLQCSDLMVSSDKIDFIIGEVKNTIEPANFNKNTLMSTVENFNYLLRWLGVLNDTQINCVAEALYDGINSNENQFPTVVVLSEGKNQAVSSLSQFRAILFDLHPGHEEDGRCIHGTTIMNYLWKCFRPDKHRSECGIRYDFGAWGPIYEPIVRYFKDKKRVTPGTIIDLIGWVTSEYPVVSTGSPRYRAQEVKAKQREIK